MIQNMKREIIGNQISIEDEVFSAGCLVSQFGKHGPGENQLQ
jgi:hypothetical protein